MAWKQLIQSSSFKWIKITFFKKLETIRIQEQSKYMLKFDTESVTMVYHHCRRGKW